MENEREPDTLTENPVPEVLFSDAEGHVTVGASEFPVRVTVPEAKCSIGAYCSEHGFFHGGEAEELREGLEQLVEANRDVSSSELQSLLYRVDARDSLAFLEAQDANSDSPPAPSAPSVPTDWVERCERLQAELEAAKQREQKHLDMIERLSALAEEWAAGPWTKADGCHEEFQALTRAHLKENGRG